VSAGPQQPPANEAAPQLRRPRLGRVLAGVAAGLAERLDVDVAVVRVLFVVVAILTNGLGLVAYALAWILVPAGGAGSAPAAAGTDVSDDRGRDPLFWVGLGLLILGALWLMGGPFGPLRWIPSLLDPGIVIPLVLIAFGVALWRSSGRSVGPPAPPSDPVASGATPSVPPPTGPPVAGPTHWGSTAVAPPWSGWPTAPQPEQPHLDTESSVMSEHQGPSSADEPDATAEVSGPPTGTDQEPGRGWRPPPPDGPAGTDPTWAPPPVPERERSTLGQLTIGVLLIVVGVLWLLRMAGVYPATFTHLVAAALLVIGLGLLIGTVAGRARWLIVVGLLLLPLLLVGQLVRPLVVGNWLSPGQRGAVGEIRTAPAAPEDVLGSYRLGAGELRLDLSGVEFEEDTRIAIQVGAGDVRVTVPEDVSVRVEGRAGAGDLRLLDDRVSGVGLERTVTDEVPGAITLELDVQVGFGEVLVSRGATGALGAPLASRPGSIMGGV